MSLILQNAPKDLGYYTIPTLPSFRLRCTRAQMKAIVYRVSYGNLKEIFVGSYTPFKNIVEIDFKEILSSIMSTQEPDQIYVNIQQSGFLREIYILFQDEDGEVESTFYLLNAKVNVTSDVLDTLSKMFLTFQPNVKETTTNSPEYLTYLYIGTKRLVAKFYETSGKREEVVTLFSTRDKYPTAITYNVSYDMVVPLLRRSEKKPFYDVYVIDENGQLASSIQRYVLRPSTSKDNYYMYKNSLGGIDTIITTGDMSYVPEMSFDVAKKSTGLIQLESIDDHMVYEQKSGYFPLDYIPFFVDFIKSKNGQIYNAATKTLEKIILTEVNSSFNRSENFINFNFSYRKNNEITEITNIEKQILVIEDIKIPSMPESTDNTVDLYTSDLIECTNDSVILSVETYSEVSIYTSSEVGPRWNLVEKMTIEGYTELTLHKLVIGSYIKIESKKPIIIIDVSFFTDAIKEKEIWNNEDIWDNETPWN